MRTPQNKPQTSALKKLQAWKFFPQLYWILYICRLEQFSRLSRSAQLLQKSKQYFNRKQNATEQLLHSLADEKFKQALQAKQAFRQDGKPLPLGSVQDHYFPPDIVLLSSKEVFVDAGAFTGDSIRRFQRACKGQYKQIIALEANPDMCVHLQAKGFKNCLCLPCGLWKGKSTLSFCAQNTGMDKLIDSHGECFAPKKGKILSIDTNALDNLPFCQEVTYLKMDIEGAEKAIRANTPTLAISIYHSDSNLLESPFWIISLGLDYKTTYAITELPLQRLFFMLFLPGIEFQPKLIPNRFYLTTEYQQGNTYDYYFWNSCDTYFIGNTLSRL